MVRSTQSPAIDIVDGTSHEECLIAKQERNDSRNLDRFRSPLLCSHLQTAFYILGVLTLGLGCINRA